MKLCVECGKGAPRLRKERCDACYMRLYRGGEVPPGASCAGCGEERRAVLVNAELGGAEVVICGNCQVVLARARPRLAAIEELRGKVTRDRRTGADLRRDGGRRTLDHLPPPPVLDPSID